MYRAFDLKDLSISFFPEQNRKFYIVQGRNATAEGKAAVQQTLKAIATNKAVLNGQEIQDAWFPKVKADVFLSHSHRDEDFILILAGWLNYHLGLKAFIDSSVWGYAGTLLKLIDDEYCYQEISDTYNYERRNDSTSHIHMMLLTSLQKMIHKTECLIFVNTPASIAAQDVVSAKTFSPWIYSELTTAGIIEITEPHRFTMKRARIAKGMIKEARELKIMHTISEMDRLIPINSETLDIWNSEYNSEGNIDAALDKLYEIASR